MQTAKEDARPEWMVYRDMGDECERIRRTKSVSIAHIGTVLLGIVLLLPLTIPFLNPIDAKAIPLLMAMLGVLALGLVAFGMLGSMSRDLF